MLTFDNYSVNFVIFSSWILGFSLDWLFDFSIFLLMIISSGKKGRLGFWFLVMNFNLLKCIIVEMKNCFIRTMFKFMLSLFISISVAKILRRISVKRSLRNTGFRAISWEATVVSDGRLFCILVWASFCFFIFYRRRCTGVHA